MDKPAFQKLDAVAMPLDRRNVDTDQIIPARFLRKPRAAGMSDYLFFDLRHDQSGADRPDFVLNDPRFKGAAALVARENFGSGSSREAAVYALWDYGFRAIIAPSFGDIFYSNALKNGLLPIVLGNRAVALLIDTLLSQPANRVLIDLVTQRVSMGDGFEQTFEIDPFQKQLLVSGQDELGYTLALADKADAFERSRRDTAPWL